MMKRKIRIRIADPAGNITIFVLDHFERSQYQKIATQLLAMEEFHAEQVAFIKNDDTMEMCGLEFCGNASRSFALICAQNRGISGRAVMTVNVSGSSEPLRVSIDTDTNYTRIKMPAPLSVTSISGCPLECVNGSVLVDLGGISHVVLHNITGTKETFDVIRNFINREFDPPAMGVMFYNDEDSSLVPVVYVKDVDTTYFEGSCGSGSTAVAVALSIGMADGTHSFDFTQPAGDITATAEIVDGSLAAVYIEGPVSISDPVSVEVDL